MFNSDILDLAIGMIFVYLLLSLMCSAANEIIELWLKNRAQDLEKGLRELLTSSNDVVVSSPPASPPGGASAPADALMKLLYDHPFLNGLFEGTYDEVLNFRSRNWFSRLIRRALALSPKLPSYIPSRNFALALMDIASPATAENRSGASGATDVRGLISSPPGFSVDALRDAIVKGGVIGPDSKVGKALLTLIDAAGNDATKARENIENWFDSSMDRVSGWYKRRSQIIVLVIALVISVAVNADSIVIAKRIWSDRSLRASLVSAADSYAKANANPSPTPTPNPAPGANNPPPPPASTPVTPCEQEACEGKDKDGNEKKESETCRQKMIDCDLERCWRDTCPPGKEDSPQCKLKKTDCQIKNLGLPIGWDNHFPSFDILKPREFVARWSAPFHDHFFGWLLTALAISLGAPFWFDLLNKFIVIRSTVKPKEKSPEEPSKD